MTNSTDLSAPSRSTPDTHQRNADKLKRIPILVAADSTVTPKPSWIRTRLGNSQKVGQIKQILRRNHLHSVCEEASCPNLSECFTRGTATFMILGDLCTRRCPFCDVAHGRPLPPDLNEPEHLAETVRKLNLNYVVITSVNRDDLLDGGAKHFALCISAIRRSSPNTRIEILTPDFRGRQPLALGTFDDASLPDVFNHNLETVPRLYKAARPGADYQVSLNLLEAFKSNHPEIPTKSGLMLGLGENNEEILSVLSDLRRHGCDMVTLGQYLQPSRDHLPIARYVTPQEFDALDLAARQMGFSSVASGPMVRSSYHADIQAGSLPRAD